MPGLESMNPVQIELSLTHFVQVWLRRWVFILLGTATLSILFQYGKTWGGAATGSVDAVWKSHWLYIRNPEVVRIDHQNLFRTDVLLQNDAELEAVFFSEDFRRLVAGALKQWPKAQFRMTGVQRVYRPLEVHGAVIEVKLNYSGIDQTDEVEKLDQVLISALNQLFDPKLKESFQIAQEILANEKAGPSVGYSSVHQIRYRQLRQKASTLPIFSIYLGEEWMQQGGRQVEVMRSNRASATLVGSLVTFSCFFGMLGLVLLFELWKNRGR